MKSIGGVLTLMVCLFISMGYYLAWAPDYYFNKGRIETEKAFQPLIDSLKRKNMECTRKLRKKDIQLDSFQYLLDDWKEKYLKTSIDLNLSKDTVRLLMEQILAIDDSLISLELEKDRLADTLRMLKVESDSIKSIMTDWGEESVDTAGLLEVGKGFELDIFFSRQIIRFIGYGLLIILVIASTLIIRRKPPSRFL
ncbi:MAG TPA: hypothetical protein PKB07_04205 [Flavilitoribacter sp.]|nr:hypothetical protein [Flavilitoribacter sp.]